MNQHQSVTELYGLLCGRFRSMKKSEEKLERTCSRCTRFEKDHVNGDKCDSYVTSFSFVPDDAEERRKVIISLELIEKLAEINGWDFS